MSDTTDTTSARCDFAMALRDICTSCKMRFEMNDTCNGIERVGKSDYAIVYDEESGEWQLQETHWGTWTCMSIRWQPATIYIEMRYTRRMREIYRNIVPSGVSLMRFDVYCEEEMDCALDCIRKLVERFASARDRWRNYSACVIQRAFRRVISNPEHAMCRKRLRREFEEMV